MAFSVAGRDVHWYGLIIAASILLALPLTVRRAGVRGIAPAETERAFWWMVVGGVIGARLLYVAQNVPYYAAHVGDVIAVWDGGLAIHGAILGGALALAAAVGFQRARFWALADAAVPGLLIGMIAGRFGNFANAELYGLPTDVAWKLYIPETARLPGYELIAYYHPTFLYDALANAVLLVLLLVNESKLRRPSELTLWFFLGIAVTRFVSEIWRIGDDAVGPLSAAQLASVLIALSMSALLFRFRSAR